MSLPIQIWTEADQRIADGVRAKFLALREQTVSQPEGERLWRAKLLEQARHYAGIFEAGDAELLAELEAPPEEEMPEIEDMVFVFMVIEATHKHHVYEEIRSGTADKGMIPPLDDATK